MPKAIDLTNFENDHIRVINLMEERYVSPKGHPIRKWLIECKYCERRFGILRHSIHKTKSCGCRGQSFVYCHHPLRNRYDKIISRCENTANPYWADYGGRGIRICQGFRHNFEFFVKKVNAPPDINSSLDREDNNANYSCGECHECSSQGWSFNLRWATKKEQAQNRRNNVMVRHLNELMPMKQVCEILNLPYKLVHQYIQRSNSTFEEAKNYYLNKKNG